MGMKQIVKYCIRKVQCKFIDFLHPQAIKLFWFRGKHNFGDALNPLLIENLSKKKVVWVEPEFCNKINYLVIGSILERASTHTTVWGSGFISQTGKCINPPHKICAVRGPLTRKLLLQDNIACPEVYGDPALLLPTVYNPKIEKKYKLGIVPHYVDRDNAWLEKLKNDKDIKILNIQEPNLYTFIDEVLQCEKIASSSLHGLIIADAYDIPSIWIEFSDKIVGGGFKFLDYFASVEREDTEPLKIDSTTEVETIYNQFYVYKIKIDLALLMHAFPLKQRSIR